MDTSYTEIVKVLQDYFDGFYASDVEKLKGVFHPNCHLMSATAGPLADDDCDAGSRRIIQRDGSEIRFSLRIPAPVSG